MQKNDKKVLTLSFVIPTFNSEKTLSACLSSITSQKYPKHAIEIILADGGSNDSTFSIAKQFGAKLLTIDSAKQGAEYNRAIGSWEAKNDILVFLDHDNLLPHQNWLNEMTKPLEEDKDIVGVETLRYAYERNAPVLGRYFSLFCVNDIVPFYLGKADRLSYMYDTLSAYGVFKKAQIREKDTYYVVDFHKNAIPTLGSNGFLIRRRLLLEHAQSEPDYFFHIDVNADLIKKGYRRYAFVKDVINHATDERGLYDYVRRRKLFVEKYHFNATVRRRYSVYEKKDRLRLFLFIVFALTFVVPFIDALRGFFRVRDFAWFLNPIVSFLMVIVYSVSVVTHTLKQNVQKIIQ